MNGNKVERSTHLYDGEAVELSWLGEGGKKVLKNVKATESTRRKKKH